MAFVATAKPDEAKRFYAETLGLRFQHEDEYALVFTVNQTILLRVQKVSSLTPQHFTVLGWQVDDMNQAVTELAERGVRFENYSFPSQDDRGICTFPGGDKVAWFKDPDGNTLSLTQLVVA